MINHKAQAPQQHLLVKHELKMFTSHNTRVTILTDPVAHTTSIRTQPPSDAPGPA